MRAITMRVKFCPAKLLRFAVQDDRRRANGRTADAALLAGVALRTGLLDRRGALDVELFEAPQPHPQSPSSSLISPSMVSNSPPRPRPSTGPSPIDFEYVGHAAGLRRARVFQILIWSLSFFMSISSGSVYTAHAGVGLAPDRRDRSDKQHGQPRRYAADLDVDRGDHRVAVRWDGYKREFEPFPLEKMHAARFHVRMLNRAKADRHSAHRRP